MYICIGMDMSTGLLLKHRGIAGVQRRRGIDVCKRILGRYGGKQVKRRTVAQGGASEVSDGGHGHGLRSVSQMRTLTLESVNEIYVIGLYDKCRTRHRVNGKPSSRSYQMRKGMVSFAGCENERDEPNMKSQIYVSSEGGP